MQRFLYIARPLETRSHPLFVPLIAVLLVSRDNEIWKLESALKLKFNPPQFILSRFCSPLQVKTVCVLRIAQPLRLRPQPHGGKPEDWIILLRKEYCGYKLRLTRPLALEEPNSSGQSGCGWMLLTMPTGRTIEVFREEQH